MLTNLQNSIELASTAVKSIDVWSRKILVNFSRRMEDPNANGRLRMPFFSRAGAVGSGSSLCRERGQASATTRTLPHQYGPEHRYRKLGQDASADSKSR